MSDFFSRSDDRNEAFSGVVAWPRGELGVEVGDFSLRFFFSVYFSRDDRWVPRDKWIGRIAGLWMNSYFLYYYGLKKSCLPVLLQTTSS